MEPSPSVRQVGRLGSEIKPSAELVGTFSMPDASDAKTADNITRRNGKEAGIMAITH